MSTSRQTVPLADQFEAPQHQTWLALVDKALKGGDFEKRLVSRTADGLRISPLYTRADALPGSDAAEPGTAPFVRGLHAQPEGLGWSIEQIVAAQDAASANAAALAELEGGATGIVLRIAAPGQAGMPLGGATDLVRALQGVYLEFAPIGLDAGPNGANAAKDLAQALRTLKAPADRALPRFDLDPIGMLAATGHAEAEPDTLAATAVAQAKELRSEFTRARTLVANGRVAHEAGGSEAQEIAVMAASLVAYLRAFEAAGVAPGEALAQMSLSLASDADLFLTIAKLRAARRVAARIAEASGAASAAARLRLAVQTSSRMMTKRDPWTNMLRTTAATAGAALGGADTITVLPYTWALGWPDAFAARIARNTQIVAQEESGLGRIVDPAGGSWYVERLTGDLAARAWEVFQSIEAAGGIVAALRSGSIQRAVMETSAARNKALATGRQQLTGTSAFPLLGGDGVTVAPWPAATAFSGRAVSAPLAPHRLAEPFEELRDAADATERTAGVRPAVFLASLGTIADHTARTTWIKNQLAVAGIGSHASDGYADGATAATAFKASGLHAACICSSDAIYAAQAEKTAKALVEAGAGPVLVAGRPGDMEAALRAAGVDGFLYAGQDAIATLGELQRFLTQQRS
ncbi:MAG: methylmalonyl-CoA mutase family protein [Hyphomicrobiaceae bacterium]